MRTFLAFLLLCSLLVDMSGAEVKQDCSHYSNEYYLASKAICDECPTLIAEENIGELCEFLLLSAMNLWRGLFRGRPLRESEPLLTESERWKPERKWDYAAGRLSWPVALGLFLVNFLVFGQGRAAGILYMNFMSDFHIDRKRASSPYSVQQATGMLFGPVVNTVDGKFGIWRVIILGCIITALSSASCYVAEDIEWIIILWGGVYGIGAAFTSAINVALIERYFTQCRSSASNVAFSGTCFGAVVFPALMEILIQKYGIQGSFLIMGSVTLNAVPVAMLLSERRRKSESGGDRKSDDEDSFEAGSGCASGSKNLRTTSAPFFDSGVFRRPREESRMRESGSLPHEDGRTFLPVSTHCNPHKNYSCEKSVETFADSPKLKEDRHPRKNSQMKGNVSVACKNGKCLENSNQEKVCIGMFHDANNVSQGSSEDFRMSRYVDNSDDKRKEGRDLMIPRCKASYENGLIYSYESSSDKHFSFDSAPNGEKEEEISKQFKKNLNSCKTSKCNKRVVPGKFRPQMSYENVINFKILHENNDFVLNLLSNEIPTGGEETIALSGEIAQNDLESPDVKLISQELQRIECILQQPYDKVQRFLNDIREKMRKFKHLLDRDRSKYLMQKKLDLEGRKLKYKDIRNMTIRKSEYTVEIFEYCCEIPIEFYVPIKLQELYEGSYCSGDKRIPKVLTQLKKLHDVFSGNPVVFRSSAESQAFKSKTLSEIGSSSEDMKLIERRTNIRSNPAITALKLHANPMFLLICLCRGLAALTFVPVVTSVVDFAVDKGMAQSDGIYAIAALSVGDLVGRLCTGWVTDKGCINDVKYMATALILQGILTAALPQTRGATMVLPTLLVFAIFQGSLFVKQPVMLVKYLREHEKRIGLGFINLFYGILGYLIPYYIGYVRDYLGSYDKMYYINGGLSAFVGLLWIFESYWIRFVPVIAKGEENLVSL